MRSLALVASCLLLCACPDLPEGRLLCAVDDDCPSSWRCDVTDNRCYSSFVDAGMCEPGSTVSHAGCVDVDECLTSGVCGPDSTCSNTAPGFSCACGSGSTLNPTTGLCEDIDECVAFTHDCHPYASCANTSGAFTCACDTRFAGDGRTCAPTCNPGTDGDAGALMFTVTHLRLPTFETYDFDRLNNASGINGGMGETVPGCGKTDGVGGVENAFGQLSTELEEQLGLPSALSAVQADGITVQVSRVGPGTPANDPCVGVVLTISGNAYTGIGALTNNVLEVTFSEPIRVIPQLAAPMLCSDPEVCGAPFPIVLRIARARILLDAGHTQILAGSTVGGVIYVRDPDGSDPDTIHETIDTFTEAIGQGGAAVVIRQIFLHASDLHLTANGRLSACELVPPPTDATNANAISAAFEFDSL